MTQSTARTMALAIKEYESGARVADIAAKYKINRATLTSRLKKAGIKMRGAALIRLGEADNKEVAHMYNTGQSVLSIAQHMQCSTHVVRTTLARQNVARRTLAEQLLHSIGGWSSRQRDEVAEKAAALYIDGQTISHIASALGMTIQRIDSLLKLKKVPRRALGIDCRKSIDIGELKAKYDAGESILALSKFFGVSRIVIQHRLQEMNVRRRTMSEQRLLINADMSPEQRKKRAEAAAIYLRGTTQGNANQRDRAAARQLRAEMTSKELDFLKNLCRIGCYVTPQYAVDKYNVDFAVAHARVAIEVKSGWSSFGKKGMKDERKRKYLESIGWVTFDCVGSSWSQSWEKPILDLVATRLRAQLT